MADNQEFGVITKAKDLVKHTFMMTNSDKRFPRKYRFTLVNRMIDRALEIYDLIEDANELDLADPQEYRERRYEQKKALTKCKQLLFLIEVAAERERITKEQCEAWSRCVLDVKNMTATWRKRDRERVMGQQQRGNAPRR